MASVTAKLIDTVLQRGDDTFIGSENNAYRTFAATVYFDNNSLQVAGGTDTLDQNVATAIQNAKRNGKTVTVRSASVTQTLQNSVNTFSATLAISGTTTVQLTPKGSSNNDWSTNATITAVAANRPYGVHVTYTEA